MREGRRERGVGWAGGGARICPEQPAAAAACVDARAITAHDRNKPLWSTERRATGPPRAAGTRSSR